MKFVAFNRSTAEIVTARSPYRLWRVLIKDCYPEDAPRLHSVWEFGLNNPDAGGFPRLGLLIGRLEPAEVGSVVLIRGKQKKVFPL